MSASSAYKYSRAVERQSAGRCPSWIFQSCPQLWHSEIKRQNAASLTSHQVEYERGGQGRGRVGRLGKAGQHLLRGPEDLGGGGDDVGEDEQPGQGVFVVGRRRREGGRQVARVLGLA